MTVQPGWYADPAEPTTQRYWDGEGWLGDPLPIEATPPPGPPATAPAEEAAPAATGGDPGPAAGGDRAAEPTSPGAASPASAPPTSAPPYAAPPGSTPPTSAPPGPPYAAPPGSAPPGGPVSGGPGGEAYPGMPPGPAGQPGPPPPGWPAAPYGFPPGWAPPPRPHGHPLAPFGPRLAARLIDIGVVLLLNVLVNSFFVYRYVQEVEPVFREVLRRSLAGNSSTEGLPQISGQADVLQVVIVLIAAALWFAYEVPAIANNGQTFGKRLMGVKVVPLSADEPLGFGRSLRRWNLLGLPTFLWCCGLGFLLQLVDCIFPLFDRPLRQALHDKRAQTVVVQVPVLRPAAPGTASRPDESDRPGDRP